jgi:hypothetical protein
VLWRLGRPADLLWDCCGGRLTGRSADDPGVGHVFETTTGGTSWTDVSGNLPDAPMDDIVFEGGKLVVASDFNP